MKCAICHLVMQPYEFDVLDAFEVINPLTFRKANIHSDCFQDALDIAKETESSNHKLYQNRYDEYITTKL